MVQIFSVHQQSVGEFIFSDRICNALVTNRDILVDIPFLTLSLQVVATIRRYLQSPGASYSHCSICSSQVLVVLSPWLVSVLVNGVTRQTSGVITQSGQSSGVSVVMNSKSLPNTEYIRKLNMPRILNIFNSQKMTEYKY